MKNKNYFIQLLVTIPLLHSVISDAAGPVTHALIGQLWLERCPKMYTLDQKKKFLDGTLFPDIRYPAKLARTSTHDIDTSLANISEQQDPFIAGKKFHAWVDDVRERFVTPQRKKELYSLMPDIPPAARSTFLKFLEDEALYPQVAQAFVRSAIKVINPNELRFPISSATLQAWHQLLWDHFTYKPSVIFAQLAQQNKPYGSMPAELVKLWSKLLPYYAKLPALKKHAQELLLYFKNKLNHCFSRQTYPWQSTDNL